MFQHHPGHGFTIWITGMQGAGKHTLAREVVTRLQRLERPVEFLDGPEWQSFTGKPPGETQEERLAVIRRTGFLARSLTRAGGFAVVAQVSPYKEARDALRREIGRFLEVFVDCPIETLKERDPTGRYAKAERGEIPNFIGVTEPYEPPRAPEVWYDSSRQSVDDAATAVLEALVREGALKPDDVGLSRKPRKPAGKKKKEPPRLIQAAAPAPKKPAAAGKQKVATAAKKAAKPEKKKTAPAKAPEKKLPVRAPAAAAKKKVAAKAAPKAPAKKAPAKKQKVPAARTRAPAQKAAPAKPAKAAVRARPAAKTARTTAAKKPAARVAAQKARTPAKASKAARAVKTSARPAKGKPSAGRRR